MVHDLPRSQRFYSHLLGWTFTQGAAEFGGYCTATVGADDAGDGPAAVAGMSPAMPGMAGIAPEWVVHLATDNVDATHSAALAAGATTIVAPMPIPGAGAMAMWTDPTGAVVGGWQAGEHTGFQRYDEPGTVVWADVSATDEAAAKRFYGEVFGWSFQDVSHEDQRYFMVSVPGGDRPCSGLGVIAAEAVAAGQPTGWLVCFGHADVDAAAQQIPSLGGTVLQAPFDIEFGRVLVAAGPEGERFMLITQP